MLLILMYHQIAVPGCPPSDALRHHLEHLADRFQIVTPGESPQRSSAICLTFDDAYFDFYAVVYPLLVELNLRAVLAVPVKFILDHTNQSPEARLSAVNDAAMRGNIYREQAPFCTWQEICTMVDSGLVTVASHSYSHPDMASGAIDFDLELIQSKQTIEEKTGQAVTTFVYPYGNTTRTVHRRVQQQYRYIMRIGSATNRGWKQPGQLLYRVDADPLWQHDIKISPLWLAKHRAKFFLNRLRGK